MSSIWRLLSVTALLYGIGQAVVNSKTPQIGWNSWNTFKADINESVIKQHADLLVSTGLRDVGYKYLILDDGWQNSSRAADGRQQANTTRFSSGMAGLGNYIHENGLKYGIYSDNGILGCNPNSPGSWGYEELDAATYASWEVDYLKYDNCGTYEAGTHSPPARYRIMRNALLDAGRDIFYSICQWGDQFPWFWADQVGHSYRMSGDITDMFSDRDEGCDCRTAYCLNTGYAGCSVMTIIRKMREMSQFQHSGSFADMDMLEIGVANMTLEEQRTHMAVWAALKSPLIIGADLTKISDESLGVLKNEAMVSICKDELGTAVRYLPTLSEEDSSQVWAGPLSGERTLILIFNELERSQNFSLALTEVPGLGGRGQYQVTDAWSRRRHDVSGPSMSTSLRSHETKVLVFS
ncbi:uncharacterized protein LTR77_004628 [Saxophila tyrrhenica]|uniref:Alpha-galactosidase n=1 Tax=Saxophila tyrrhenica TaxID=1690608 RepID=A0AAV9PEE7_9PEZI|nr:hypothetical protein LTR77_004628 [Saxophila tyrrhenica]